MKDLLFLSHRVPYPPTKGDKIRSYNMLKHLARDYRIHLGTFIDDPADWRHVDELRALCASTCFVDLKPKLSRLRSLVGLATCEPLSVRFYNRSRLAHWTAQTLRRHQVKRAFVFSSPMAQYLPDPPSERLRCVIDFVDVDSEKWRQYAHVHRWPVSWLYRREARRLLRFDRWAAAISDVSTFVSREEANLFQRLAPEVADRVQVVENGVDTEFFDPSSGYADPYQGQQRVLVFTGAMDYWANVDAVCWFAREVFPQIRAQMSDCMFAIVGARPTDGVRRLEQQSGVMVTGAVRDIRPYLAHARLAVAPLRIARGVQNKVLEAMAMGTEVLATPEAVEGIAIGTGKGLQIGADPTELARLAVSRFREAPAAETRAALRDWVLRRYSWRQNLSRLESLLEGDSPCPNAEFVHGRAALA